MIVCVLKGVYNDGSDDNQTGFDHDSDPHSVEDIIEDSKMISIDNCGVMYETIMDYDTAEREFEQFQQWKNFTTTRAPYEDTTDDDNDNDGEGTRRRMQTADGLVSSSGQISIGEYTSLSYPDNTIGCMTFISSSYDNSGGIYDGYNYEYDHICTVTLI